jgi:DNA-binding winged helix-turn-helix (wHTH) protein/cytochrome c-type biogenesis protein CcmH/NrfG
MSVYEFGPFQLDEARLLLLDRGVPLPLGPKVVETLLALIEHPGEVFPKNDLLARIWPEGYVDEANLAQNIYVLRKTLRARWDAEAIETIPRRGYRFTAPVRRREDVPRPEPAKALSAPPLRRRGAVLAAACALALLGGSALTSSMPTAANAGANHLAQDSRLYAMGRYYWNLRTRDGVAKSVEYFSRIVANNSDDARGYAGLASANAIMADYGYGSASPMVDVSRARALARKALAIDPNSSEAYSVLGFISGTKYEDSKHADQAIAYLRRAIALDPTNGAAHEWYGTMLLEQGRVDEAYTELSKAAQLEPLAVATTQWLGTTAYLKGHYRDAVNFAREALDLVPERSEAYETLGLAYEALGDQPHALQSFGRYAQACRKCRAEGAALLTAVYAQANQMARARAELTFAQAHVMDVHPEDLAAAFESVGDHRAALTWVKKAQSDGYYAMEIANDPRFAGLRRSIVSRQQKPA